MHESPVAVRQNSRKKREACTALKLHCPVSRVPCCFLRFVEEKMIEITSPPRQEKAKQEMLYDDVALDYWSWR